MKLLELLSDKWRDVEHPAIVLDGSEIKFKEIIEMPFSHLFEISKGDVVALIGDFNPQTISNLLYLIDIETIIVPLTVETRNDHEYFFNSALVDWIVEDGNVRKRIHSDKHDLINKLRHQQSGGLVLFSTGTTGRPKAILHDLALFLQRYNFPRPQLKTLAFLLFDHIGGINTLLHTMYNKGTLILTKERSVESIINLINSYQIQVLPTTPTFLRMMLFSGLIPHKIPRSLKVITYGTEKMDAETLQKLSDMLPSVDFRQTYGMSELGILRVRSEARNSLYMKIGGEGVEIRIREDNLEIKSNSRMMGYLNAPSPFDEFGWYKTNDLVESKNEWIKIIGRSNGVVNVGGLKFLLNEIENACYGHPEVKLALAEARTNPITGQHVELRIQIEENSTLQISEIRQFLSAKLPIHMIPRRITFGKVEFNHRYKKNMDSRTGLENE